ncbi:MAG: ABC transporter ATP-binding protein [Candidatus Thermoplasmatota archaeon]|nr:ABC transporter ATP-binding protein [Candidatus Thermoplasmatota archaeon]
MLFSTYGLSKSYGSFMALNDLTIDVEEGTVGLLGPNGAGKSTLLRILLGLIETSGGSYEILGNRKGRVALDMVGYMPEHDCLPPGLTAVGFVSYFGQLSGLPPDVAMERTHQTLDYVGLEEERYREIESYSTGMKQRVKLAQAIVHDPMVIFLDEPTNGMDPEGREEMLSLLRGIASIGKSIVLSSHLLPDVEFVCEDAIIINNGELVEQGKVKELLGLQTLRVKIRGDEKGFVNVLREKECNVSGTGSELVVEGDDITHKVWDAALDANVQIRYMGFRSRSLEELFLDIVEGNNGN